MTPKRDVRRPRNNVRPHKTSGVAKMKLRSYQKHQKCSCAVQPSKFKKPVTEVRTHHKLMNMTVRTNDDERIPVHSYHLCGLSDQIFESFIDAGGLYQDVGLDISSHILQPVLDLAYTGHCEVDSENIVDLLRVGASLQIPLVKNLCGQYLLDNISTFNAVWTFKMVQEYLCAHRLSEVERFMRRNFPELILEESCKVSIHKN
jgi:hypothetical protein